MRKLFVPVLAVLLTLAMVIGFAACGGGKTPETTDPETTIEEITEPVVADPPNTFDPDETTTEPSTDEDVTEASSDESTTEAPDTTTKEGDTEAETTTKAPDKFAPPENLGSLSQAEQLAYFNLVTGRVRTEQPGYVRTEQLKVQDMKFTGVVSLFQSVVNSVVADLMPGDLETSTIAKKADNKTKFMSENANPSELRVQDINSIKSTKSGANWLIEVSVKDATNPSKLLGSTVSRIASMQTREEIIDSITGAGPITSDPNNASVRYHTIYARVTVNAQGQVIEGANGFDVAASTKGTKIIGISTDADFTQTSRWTYKNFQW